MANEVMSMPANALIRSDSNVIITIKRKLFKYDSRLILGRSVLWSTTIVAGWQSLLMITAADLTAKIMISVYICEYTLQNAFCIVFWTFSTIFLVLKKTIYNTPYIGKYSLICTEVSRNALYCKNRNHFDI